MAQLDSIISLLLCLHSHIYEQAAVGRPLSFPLTGGYLGKPPFRHPQGQPLSRLAIDYGNGARPARPVSRALLIGIKGQSGTEPTYLSVPTAGSGTQAELSLLSIPPYFLYPAGRPISLLLLRWFHTTLRSRITIYPLYEIEDRYNAYPGSNILSLSPSRDRTSIRSCCWLDSGW